MTEGRIELADTVHHIIPLRDNWSIRNDITNLMSLNHDTHSMIEQMYRKDKNGTQRILQDMLSEYRAGRGGQKSF
nr:MULTISPECIES: HNH endonuclease [Clostridia]